MKDRFHDIIQTSIEKREQIAPFLFISHSTQHVELQLTGLVSSLRGEYNIPHAYIYRLEDNNESLKISDIRVFIQKSHIKPDYNLQIFIIENISRLTLASANSLLKFLEEPGLGNLVLLTNSSESSVIDTILSRVKIMHIGTEKQDKSVSSIENMIKNYIELSEIDLVTYYYQKQIIKQDGLDFLYSLIAYLKTSNHIVFEINEIHRDINGIGNNNINSKFIIDAYILKLETYIQ